MNLVHVSVPNKYVVLQRLYVCSLNKNVPDDELTSNVSDHFQQWGKVMGVKVLQDWLKRPYAFVQYEVCEYISINTL